MTTATTPDVHHALRAHAHGIFPDEAGTELLIRAGFADADHPWVRSGPHGTWIDPIALTERSSGLSGGERRLIAIAISLMTGVAVDLRDAAVGLDARWLRLALAAIAHAGGHRSAWETVSR